VLIVFSRCYTIYSKPFSHLKGVFWGEQVFLPPLTPAILFPLHGFSVRPVNILYMNPRHLREIYKLIHQGSGIHVGEGVKAAG
jgi:hypothetical protein